jgi:glycosyltransferase involved in cell wall biosynthesis
MRILFCAPINLSFVRGGIVTVIASIKKALEDHGLQVDFLSPLEPVDRGRYDVLHIFSSVASFDLYFVAEYAKKSGMKVVFNPIIYGRWPAWLIRAEVAVLSRVPHIYNWHVYLKKVLDMSDAITPNTNAEADYISKSFRIPIERMRFIPNGVDDRFLSGDPELIRKKTGFRDFALTVGYVGERKNQIRVLEAARRLGMPFVSIGKIQDDAYCREFLRLTENRKDVAVLDQMSNGDQLLASAYAAASVFVLASWWETPGVAALEAGLAGAPVVITEVGGTRDYFSDLADYAEYGSVESIRSGIERALARPRDHRLREHIRQNFTWPSVGKKIAELYGSL